MVLTPQCLNLEDGNRTVYRSCVKDCKYPSSTNFNSFNLNNVWLYNGFSWLAFTKTINQSIKGLLVVMNGQL